MLPSWVSEYIGIPFVSHGRGPDGCDCYGLVRLVLSDHFGKVLPMFSDGYDSSDRFIEARLIDEGLPLIGASKVESPEPGDIVLMCFVGITSHVGIYLGDDRIMHTTEGRGSVIESMDSPLIRSRLRGFYHVD